MSFIYSLVDKIRSRKNVVETKRIFETKNEDCPPALRFQTAIQTGICGEGVMDVPVFRNSKTGMYTTWIGEVECTGICGKGLGLDILKKTDLKFLDYTWSDTCLVNL